MNDQSNRFTLAEEELCMGQFNEGCELFIDPDYVRWLRIINHPEKQTP